MEELLLCSKEEQPESADPKIVFEISSVIEPTSTTEFVETVHFVNPLASSSNSKT